MHDRLNNIEQTYAQQNVFVDIIKNPQLILDWNNFGLITFKGGKSL